MQKQYEKNKNIDKQMKIKFCRTCNNCNEWGYKEVDYPKLDATNEENKTANLNIE